MHAVIMLGLNHNYSLSACFNSANPIPRRVHECMWQRAALRQHTPPMCCLEVLWVSGAAGDWEEELNQASFVDQLSLDKLCDSKLDPLHPEPGMF